MPTLLDVQNEPRIKFALPNIFVFNLSVYSRFCKVLGNINRENSAIENLWSGQVFIATGVSKRRFLPDVRFFNEAPICFKESRLGSSMVAYIEMKDLGVNAASPG